jgi:hypothetical protein
VINIIHLKVAVWRTYLDELVWVINGDGGACTLGRLVLMTGYATRNTMSM